MVIQSGEAVAQKSIVLPITLTTQYNSHHPYGYNDGSFIPASGLQTQFSFGVALKAGPVNLNLQPEFIHAANPTYPSNGSYGYSSGKPYTKLYAGQSTLSVSASVLVWVYQQLINGGVPVMRVPLSCLTMRQVFPIFLLKHIGLQKHPLVILNLN
jgi:hypothetical protein